MTLVITGGLRISSDFARALALGADAVAIGTAALIAAGCQQYRICNTGKCPVGATTHDPGLRARVDIDKAAKRVENFLCVSTEELKDFARLTGHESETESLIADLEARVGAVLEVVTGVSERPSVFYELDATDPSNPWTTGSGTFIDYIITQAGGTNAAADLQGDYIQISSEQLIASNPDVILLGEIRGAEAMDYLQALNSGHKGCLAVIHAAAPSDDNVDKLIGVNRKFNFNYVNTGEQP